MSDLDQNLKSEFQDSEYRYAYAESFLNTKLATQIKTLREQRKETQVEVAARIGIKQPGYRRFEDVNHSVWRTDTLWAIAKALDVRLNISFETFGSLLDDKKRFKKEELARPKFKDDPAFKEAEKPQAEEIAALAPPVMAPIAPTAPRLSDLMSAVTQQHQELYKSLLEVTDLSPMLAGIESQYDSWTAMAGVADWMKPVKETFSLNSLYADFAKFFPDANVLMSEAAGIASIHNPYLEAKEGTMAATTPTANEAVESMRDRLGEITAVRAPVIPIDQHRAKKRPPLKRYQVARGIGRRKHG